ncbi:MAG: pentapeptide repeat-containing protein [Nostoc sp.]
MDHGWIEEANISYANLSNIRTYQSTLDKVNRRGANLSNAFFSDKTRLRKANLIGANLTGMGIGKLLTDSIYDTETIIDEKTRYLSIPGIGLFDIFERAIFLGSGENLNSANLENTDLSDLDLSEADLSYANLKGTNLSNSSLFQANLEGADLEGANLTGADL